MDPGLRAQVLARGEIHDRPQVVDVRMDATMRHEAQEMDASPSSTRPPKGAEQRVVREERTVVDRGVDAHEVLEQDATRSDREVPDLRVAHLALRQPDGLARRLQRGTRVLRPEPVEDGCLGELDRVSRPRRSETPAVEDDERDERRHAAAASAAAAQIASNAGASREAPPTSAPSTSGCARSPRALSAFTDPP